MARLERIGLGELIGAILDNIACIAERFGKTRVEFQGDDAAIDIDRCPYCRSGRWRCVEALPADPAVLRTIAAACRGPPQP